MPLCLECPCCPFFGSQRQVITLSRDGITEASTHHTESGRAAGQIAAQSADAQARRAKTKRRHDAARAAWQPSSLPAWLNEETYLGKIQPLLARLTNKAVASALGSSIPYASAIRAGRRRPHPRHWQTLAQLAGVSGEVVNRPIFNFCLNGPEAKLHFLAPTSKKG